MRELILKSITVRSYDSILIYILTKFNLDRIYCKGPNIAQPQNGRTLVIRENEVFDKITSIHNRLQHPGYKITYQAIKEQFYGISREDVEWLIKHCILCAQNSANNS